MDPNFISHDPAVVAAYKADPRVHDRISGRLARFIADGGPQVTRARAAVDGADPADVRGRRPGWSNPEGSRAFAAAAPQQVVSAHCFEGLYHEIFNEPESEPVFERLRQWLSTADAESWGQGSGHTSQISADAAQSRGSSSQCKCRQPASGAVSARSTRAPRLAGWKPEPARPALHAP